MLSMWHHAVHHQHLKFCLLTHDRDNDDDNNNNNAFQLIKRQVHAEKVLSLHRNLFCASQYGLLVQQI